MDSATDDMESDAFEEDASPSSSMGRRSLASTGGRRRSSGPPPMTYGLRPPGRRGDVPPPASFAGGWDLVYEAAAPETVKSGKGGRRVALFSKSFPVTVERKIVPALSDDAFLVAEIRNPLAEALPQGQARLSVGTDPAGTARVDLVRPGESFTLPLGIDRALKPIRNVEVDTKITGFISKDEISTYKVTIELANPYREPMAVRIVDQVPVTDDKDLDVDLVRTTPKLLSKNDKNGELIWRVNIPAQGKTAVSFTYSLKRPKGYRLRQ